MELEELFNWSIMILSGGFSLVLAVGMAHRVWRDYLCQEKQAEGILLDERSQTMTVPSNRTPTQMRTDYYLVFDINGKTKTFQVSNWVYDSVTVKERYRLRCRGNRLLSVT